MEKMKKLPDAEFEIMKVVWENEPPITTAMIMAEIGDKRKWKAPTVLTLMRRLVERGFLRTEKKGKERTYYPLISKEDYLQLETEQFMKKYHKNSFLSFVNTLYNTEPPTEEELDELLKWAKERRE
ncbi:BlaI/MecI/CopY family transcriptional regulator [Siminovitchia sp. FSL H7-0308]|uniref:Transcriptional regulator n=1 Tax=Siminovitchia thermophila TaxID=1245522 RepID=A0ABS2R0V2_9BACI|nr:BlaI/MecI/CopY family transcriptional regulator [Siminovitchia thermophila]MBM7713271.1 putative transcriptional regulator [Siminovitchia thermophila]ONK24257.1 transcriptional regulator [Bacillus sp. VT-16-64]